MSIGIDIGYDGELLVGDRSERTPVPQGSVAAVPNVQVLLVAVYDLGRPVVVEVEHGRAGDGRADIDGLVRPEDAVVAVLVGIEDDVVGASCGADLGTTVSVEVGDGRWPTARRALLTRVRGHLHRTPHEREVVVEDADRCPAGDDDLGFRIVVEVAERHIALGDARNGPYEPTLAVVDGVRGHDLRRPIEVEGADHRAAARERSVPTARVLGLPLVYQ